MITHVARFLLNFLSLLHSTKSHATLAQTQAQLAQAQADNQAFMYRFMENLEQQQQQLNRRQGEIVEILRLLTKKERGN